MAGLLSPIVLTIHMAVVVLLLALGNRLRLPGNFRSVRFNCGMGVLLFGAVGFGTLLVAFREGNGALPWLYPFAAALSVWLEEFGTALDTYRDEAVTSRGPIPDARAALRHTPDSGMQEALRPKENFSKQALRLTMIERHVRTALRQDQFYLNYQPQYEVRSGSLRGFEALLRWEHPELGNVRPGEFIPVAESVQAMAPIGEWVIREACRTLNRAAPSPSPLTMAVNVSANQLLEPGFADVVRRVLAETGLSPHRLEFEIAEPSLSGMFELAEQTMRPLRALGVRIALDNCGFNAAALSRFGKLPFQAVKIGCVPPQGSSDDYDRESGFMLEAIRGRQCEIVATRLETYEQLAFCKKNNCHFAQGNLLCRPMDGEGLSGLIAAARNAAGSPARPLPP